MEIPETMQAVVVHGVQDYRITELPVPEVCEGEVLVKILATGICASDAKCYFGALRIWGDEGMATYIHIPVTPGHEFVGEVVELGKGVAKEQNLRVGDLVVSEQIVPCRACRFCQKGQYWMCQRHDIYGFIHERAEGSWAEYMKFPSGARNYRVPRTVKPEHAVLIEPLACAMHAVERGDIQLDDVVVIAGMGPIGLCMLQVAKLKNPGLLIAVDMHPERLSLASELGAHMTLDPKQQDVARIVLDLTGGYGCDVYIEATGSVDAVSQGLHMIRRLGTFVEFSVHESKACADWSIIGDVKELTIHGSHLGPYCYPRAIKYISDETVNVAKLISHVLPLTEFQRGLELVQNQKDSLKVILKP